MKDSWDHANAISTFLAERLRVVKQDTFNCNQFDGLYDDILLQTDRKKKKMSVRATHMQPRFEVYLGHPKPVPKAAQQEHQEASN